MKNCLVWLLFGCAIDTYAQPLPNSQETLNIQSYSFTVEVPEQDQIKGGHLQGIQFSNQTLYVSGSSNRYGYLALFKQFDDDFRFLGIKKLADEPMNHAGGFQIAGNWLAIGLEDPRKKNSSVVQLIDITTASSVSAPPVFSLERTGDYKRSTAGAVAILERKDHFLLAVGSWNCTTIDLYTSNHLDPYKPDFAFTKWTIWDSREAIRKKWTDKSFGRYQSLQFTEDSTEIYLTGFILTRNGSNQADVFRLDVASNPYDLMQKVASYTVQTKEGISFRNGGGFTNYKGLPAIVAVGRNLSPKTQIQIFPIKVD